MSIRKKSASRKGSWFHIFLLLFYLFLTVLGLHCCSFFSLVVVSGGYSLVAVLQLLIAVTSLIVKHGL